MNKRQTEISLSVLMLLCLAYYIALPAEFIAVLLAVAAHESGHIIAIWILGMSVKSIKADMKGFCISYFGETGSAGHIFIAAAGPAAGLLYAWTASYYGIRLESNLLCLSSGTSLILSLFNLLPSMPLDGGRIFSRLAVIIFGERRGIRISALLSLLISVSIFLTGIYLLLNRSGAALLIASIWLLSYQDISLGIVKSREIL